MRQQAELLQAIQGDPSDALAWLALADCLEEQGEDARAELVRLREWLRFADLRDPQRPEKETRLQALLAQGVKPTVPRIAFSLGEGRPNLEVVLIPPGTFWMGSAEDEEERYSDEGPRHRVTFTRGFWMGVYPITQGQWRAVAGTDPERFSHDDNPVELVSWDECQEFWAMLRELLGTQHAFNFPTEAQWEYACRAGTTTTFFSGPDEAALARAGWYQANSEGQIQPVGQKIPNAWGLYDMHGGVWEWCQDTLREFGNGEPVTDPDGGEGEECAVRGGSYRNEPRDALRALRG